MDYHIHPEPTCPKQTYKEEETQICCRYECPGYLGAMQPWECEALPRKFIVRARQLLTPAAAAPCAREPSSGRVRAPGHRLRNQTLHIMDRRGWLRRIRGRRVTGKMRQINMLCEMRCACHAKHGKA